jgi:protein translocase SecG subunit
MDPEDLRRLLKRIAIGGAFFLVAFLIYLLGGTNYGLARGLLLAYGLLVTAVLVGAILLQSGRGGGLAGLGGLGGDSLLGARAATPIAKATYVVGALFLFICMLMARLGTEGPRVPGAVQAPPALQTQQEGQPPAGEPAEAPVPGLTVPEPEEGAEEAP